MMTSDLCNRLNLKSHIYPFNMKISLSPRFQNSFFALRPLKIAFCAFLVLPMLVACSGTESESAEQNDSIKNATASPSGHNVGPVSTVFETPDFSNPVVSQKAYDRGYAEGCRVASMTPGGRQREFALIELCGVVSALQRNGFRQSAIDFSKGVKAALDAKPLENPTTTTVIVENN